MPYQVTHTQIQLLQNIQVIATISTHKRVRSFPLQCCQLLEHSVLIQVANLPFNLASYQSIRMITIHWRRRWGRCESQVSSGVSDAREATRDRKSTRRWVWVHPPNPSVTRGLRAQTHQQRLLSIDVVRASACLHLCMRACVRVKLPHALSATHWVPAFLHRMRACVRAHTQVGTSRAEAWVMHTCTRVSESRRAT